MNKTLIEKLRNQKSYLAEAKYYLEITDYDLRKAMDQFEEDLKFEQEQKKATKKKKKFKWF